MDLDRILSTGRLANVTATLTTPQSSILIFDRGEASMLWRPLIGENSTTRATMDGAALQANDLVSL